MLYHLKNSNDSQINEFFQKQISFLDCWRFSEHIIQENTVKSIKTIQEADYFQSIKH